MPLTCPHFVTCDEASRSTGRPVFLLLQQLSSKAIKKQTDHGNQTMSKLVPNCSIMFYHVPLCSILFKLIQTCPDLFIIVQTLQDCFRLVYTCYDLSRLVQTCPYWFRLVQSGSDMIMAVLATSPQVH